LSNSALDGDKEVDGDDEEEEEEEESKRDENLRDRKRELIDDESASREEQHDDDDDRRLEIDDGESKLSSDDGIRYDDDVFIDLTMTEDLPDVATPEAARFACARCEAHGSNPCLESMRCSLVVCIIGSAIYIVFV